MSYCPECGSEVANNDTFCAYCGISLEVMTEQPVSETPQLENPPKIGEPEKIPTSASLGKDPINPNEIDEDKEESVPTPPPTHFILEDDSMAELQQKEVVKGEVNQVLNSGQTVEGSTVETTADYNLQTENKEIPADLQSEPVFNSEEEKPNPNEEKIIDPVSVIEKKTEQAGFEGKNNESPSETSVVDEFSQTIPYTPADYANQEWVTPEVKNHESAFSGMNEEERLKSVLDEIDIKFQAENNLGNQVSSATGTENIIPITDQGLNPLEIKPTENVSETEVKPEKAVIEKPLSFEDNAPFEAISPAETVPESATEQPFTKGFQPIVSSTTETPVFTEPPSPVTTPVVPVKDEQPLSNGVAAEPVKQQVTVTDSVDNLADKESRSYTNPNIGVGDTGGRGKQKLKPLEEGTLLNSRYEIIRKIGGGGMGAVYLANDKNLGGVLRAVKEMVQSYIEDEAQEKAINDFKRESLLLTSLEHPGIPTIYDYFLDEKEGRFYLVMKYISGGDLAARLRAAPEGRIDEVSVTDWAIQIADVLDYLHNRQPPIVYRDLKPSNIMIDGNTGKVMIIDFGIARWVNKEEKGVTAVGTMGYAPPELFSGNVEPRSDIYSLGSTMFHLLTGADPQSNPLLIFDFNKNPRPRQINPNLSDQMEQILMRAVEYNSEQRFSSAAEMREEMVKHLENLKKGSITFGVMSNMTSGQSLSNVPVFCGFCGQKIVATDMFCPFCGAQQPLVSQSQKLKQTPMFATPPVTAKLLIMGTSDLEHTEYALEKESNLLGRRDPMSNIFPEVDMSKFDPQTKISRKHARIWREGDLYMLEDLGSSNGTILINNKNDAVKLLPRQPHVLSNGDKLKLGDTTLRFTIG